MSYLDQAKEMYNMIGQGQMMEAFEKFYHEDVTMQENNEEPRRGKDANRQFEIEWANNVEEMHGGGVTSITSDEEAGVTMVETWADVTFKGGQRAKIEEVARQKWQDDQVIEERFYYNSAG